MFWNASTKITEFCDKMYNVQTILPMVLSPVNIFGSTLVLRAIYATSELKNMITFQFITNLSISDMMLSVIGLPLLVTLKFHSSLTMAQLKSIIVTYKVFFDTKQMVSALTLISLSVDRVLACILHLKYNSYITAFRTLLLMALIWVLSFSFGAANWAVEAEIYPGYTCLPIKATLDVTKACLTLVCFIAIFSSNLYLMWQSNQHRRRDRVQRHEEDSQSRKIYEHYKSMKSVVLIVFMFGVGLLPLVIYFLLQQFIGCTTLSCIKAWEYLIIIHYLDLNTRCIIYCLRFKLLGRCVLKISGLNRFSRVRVSPDVELNERQKNGVIVMVDEKDEDGSKRQSIK